MNLMKKIGLVVLILLIGIQLIQPARNSSGQVPATDISKTVRVLPSDETEGFYMAMIEKV